MALKASEVAARSSLRRADPSTTAPAQPAAPAASPMPTDAATTASPATAEPTPSTADVGPAEEPTAPATTAKTSPSPQSDRAQRERAQRERAGDAEPANPQGTPAAPTETRTPQAGAPEWLAKAKETSDPKELLDLVARNLPKEELARHDVLAGLIGDLGDKRAKALRAEIERDVRDRLEAERIEQLKTEDPYAGVQAERERNQRREAEKADADKREQAQAAEMDRLRQASATATKELNAAVADYARTALSAERLANLKDKTYDALPAFLTDVVEAAVADRVEAERVKLEAELTPAVRKQVLAEMNGRPETTPDLPTAPQAPGGALTNEEWHREGRDRAWRKANAARISAAVASGAITPL